MATTASHVWRPSSSRVLLLEGFVPGPRGVPARPPPPLRWPPKDPGDVLDYQLDVSSALAGNDGDAIATLDVLIVPSDVGDLSLVSSAADGARAILWLQGGQAGITYTVTLTISTEAGRQLSRSISLPVVAFVAVGSSTLPLTLEDGTALVDANGNALILSTGSP